MSLTVVITPLTVTVATAVLDEDQLKLPLPPAALNKCRFGDHVYCHVVGNNYHKYSHYASQCPFSIRGIEMVELIGRR